MGKDQKTQSDWSKIKVFLKPVRNLAVKYEIFIVIVIIIQLVANKFISGKISIHAMQLLNSVVDSLLVIIGINFIRLLIKTMKEDVIPSMKNHIK